MDQYLPKELWPDQARVARERALSQADAKAIAYRVRLRQCRQEGAAEARSDGAAVPGV
jgi:hypothetical protein